MIEGSPYYDECCSKRSDSDNLLAKNVFCLTISNFSSSLSLDKKNSEKNIFFFKSH